MKKKVSNYKGYTFYEYLTGVESNKTHGIDTGLMCDENHSITYELDMQYDAIDKRRIMGTNSTSSSYFGISSENVLERFNSRFTATDRHIYKVTFTSDCKGMGYVDGENAFSYTTNALVHYGKVALFYIGSYKSGETVLDRVNLVSYDNAYGVKLYRAKIYDNDVLVRDMIPASNKEGVYGLYDVVNDTFYTIIPLATGTFSVGDVAEVEVEYNSAIRGRWNKKNLINFEHFSNYDNWITSDTIVDSSGDLMFKEGNKGYPLNLTAGKTYTVSFDCGDTKFPAYFYLIKVINNVGTRTYLTTTVIVKKNHTFTVGAGETYYFRCSENAVIDGTVVRDADNIKSLSFIQLEEGSTATDYVPYIQEVSEIKGRWNTKNSYFNNNKQTSYGLTFVGDGSHIHYKGTKLTGFCNAYHSYPFQLKQGTYTFSIKHTSATNESTTVGLIVYDNDTDEVISKQYLYLHNNTYSKTITLENISKIRLYFDTVNGNASEGEIEGDYYVQIEEGDTATEYIPYIQSIKQVKTKVNGEVKTLFEV